MENNEELESNQAQPEVIQPGFKELHGKERQIVELKAMGTPHTEIAQQVGYHRHSISRLFMRGGRLAKALHECLEEQRQKPGPNSDRVREAHSFLKQKVLVAAEKVAELLESGNDAKVFKAAELIFAVVGISEETALRSLAKSKTYEQFVRIVGDVCQSEYGRSLQNITVMGEIKKDGIPLEFRIGDKHGVNPYTSEPEAQP